MERIIIENKINNIKIVKMKELVANDYNPNRMPEREMNLLIDCIKKYGFLFPILTIYDKEIRKYRIVDGYHRYEALKRLNAKNVMILNLDIHISDAVQLTVLMNRIKGLHQVELMSDLVLKLEDLGLTDLEICNNLGMEAEEFMRLKQQLGIAHSFKDHKYSMCWEDE